MSNFFSNLFRNFRLRKNKVVAARLKDVATIRRQANPLAKLTPQRVKDLYEAFRKGQYADVQIAWDALEEYDETLATVVDRRQSALGEMDWEITIDAQTVAGNAEKQQLAEAQQDFLASYFSRIVNLSAAVRWLGLASFRSYAALEIIPRPDGRIEWMPVMPWFIARPDPEGPWMYNPDANPSAIRLEEMDRSVLILREVARPIDLPAMFLIVAKGHALTGWDEFLDVFGNPAIFFKLPQGVSDDERDDYARLMQELIGDGRGVYPDGGEIKTVETSASKPDVFSTRAEWCDKGIVRRGTGGMLTVLAEAGSGTLAGNAQQETFRMLASADASDISECINAQVVRPLLARKFPGKPALAGWYLNNRDEKDTAAQATIIATLAGAGYRASAEVVSEQVGFAVQDAPEAPVNPATGAAFTFNRSPEPPAPADEPPPVVENAKEPPAPSVPLAEAPLTPEELDLISAITSRGLEPSQIQKDAATVCEALQGAITSEAASLPTLAGVASANRRQNSVKGQSVSMGVLSNSSGGDGDHDCHATKKACPRLAKRANAFKKTLTSQKKQAEERGTGSNNRACSYTKQFKDKATMPDQYSYTAHYCRKECKSLGIDPKDLHEYAVANAVDLFDKARPLGYEDPRRSKQSNDLQSERWVSPVFEFGGGKFKALITAKSTEKDPNTSILYNIEVHPCDYEPSADRRTQHLTPERREQKAKRNNKHKKRRGRTH